MRCYMKQIIKKIIYVFFPLLIGGLVSFIIKDFINYQEIIKPFLAPPKFIFPIAWSIIYFLMGISYALLNKNIVDKTNKIIYYGQLLVNAFWSIIFFIFHNYGLSFIWIILLDILVSLMIWRFYKTNKVSAYLNLGYLIWILFATYLTGAIWLLN